MAITFTPPFGPSTTSSTLLTNLSSSSLIWQRPSARHNLDERAEFLDRRNLAFVNLPTFTFGQRFHPQLGGLRPCGYGVSDEYRAIILDVDLGAGFFLNGADGLAARADQQADLFRIDLHRQQARGVFGDIGARLHQGLEHDAHDFQPRLASLHERGADDFLRDSVDLEIS